MHICNNRLNLREFTIESPPQLLRFSTVMPHEALPIVLKVTSDFFHLFYKNYKNTINIIIYF